MKDDKDEKFLDDSTFLYSMQKVCEEGTLDLVGIYGKLLNAIQKHYEKDVDAIYEEGCIDGFLKGKQEGYDEGYNQGHADAMYDAKFSKSSYFD